MTNLTKCIASVIERFRIEHPGLTVEQVLYSLEVIRYKLTEDLIKERMK